MNFVDVLETLGLVILLIIIGITIYEIIYAHRDKGGGGF